MISSASVRKVTTTLTSPTSSPTKERTRYSQSTTFVSRYFKIWPFCKPENPTSVHYSWGSVIVKTTVKWWRQVLANTSSILCVCASTERSAPHPQPTGPRQSGNLSHPFEILLIGSSISPPPHYFKLRDVKRQMLFVKRWDPSPVKFLTVNYPTALGS